MFKLPRITASIIALSFSCGNAVFAASITLDSNNSNGVSAIIAPDSNEIGTTANVYIGAKSGSKLFLRGATTTSWSEYTGGALPIAVAALPLSASTKIILTDFDIRKLGDLEIYVGYGKTEADLSQNGRLAKIYTSSPTSTAPACQYVDWAAGINYPLGTLVKFGPNGNYYKVVNAGNNGSDATDPTISTWYWKLSICGEPPAVNFLVTEAQFDQMFPVASRNALYTYAGLVKAISYYSGFTTTGSETVRKQEAAAFLANVAHESDKLKATREYNTANYPLYCSKGVGNCGGKEYYGRGPIQLSWDFNYAAAGAEMGVDLLNNPDLVATDSAIAWRTGVWYWMNGTGNAGMTPHAAMTSSAGFGITIKAINGPLECGGKRTDQVGQRISYYTAFTAILGVPVGDNLSC